MNTAANKSIVQRFISEIFETRDPAAVDELVADGFVSHAWPAPGGDGKAALREATERMSKALDDVVFKVDDLVAEGDRVVARVTTSATPVSEFMGIAPTGRSYSVGEIHIFRVEAGKITEHWLQMDSMDLMKQLKGDGQ